MQYPFYVFAKFIFIGGGPMPLTAKQQAFVQEYLIDLNATQAAIRAGYSVRSAMEQGYQLLQKTSVSDAIEAARGERMERLEWSADDIMRDIREIAQNRRGVEPRDRLKAYELAGRHLGMFKDKIEHSGSMGVTIQNDIPRKS
jgi:phage terminase small subunit